MQFPFSTQEMWLMPQVCQCSRSIWAMPPVTLSVLVSLEEVRQLDYTIFEDPFHQDGSLFYLYSAEIESQKKMLLNSTACRGIQTRSKSSLGTVSSFAIFPWNFLERKEDTSRSQPCEGIATEHRSQALPYQRRQPQKWFWVLAQQGKDRSCPQN